MPIRLTESAEKLFKAATSRVMLVESGADVVVTILSSSVATSTLT